MEARERIYRYLATSPGASTSMVGDHLGIDHSTADYHLRRMRKESRVTCEKSGREVVWFNVGCGFCPLLRRAMPLFRRPGVAAVAAALEEVPTMMRTLAHQAGLEKGEADWAFATLRRMGVAQRSRAGHPMLAPGAEVCVAKALAGAPCGLWGRCAPSHAAAEARSAVDRAP